MQKKYLIIISLLSVAAAGVVINRIVTHGKESTDDATIEAHVIPIAPKVSGYITALKVNDNQHVRKGEVLVEIDPRDYQLRVTAQKALLQSAEVTANNANINARRQKTIGRVVGSQREIDNAVAAEESALAQVENAKAQVALAEKELEDSAIRAPEDGVVTMRSAEQGAYANPGQQLFTLVGDARWVVANFKEVQITEMRPGQKAIIKVDAYPDLTLEGVVDSIQSGTGSRFSAFPAENATGNFVKIVQRVPVKITFNTSIPEGIVLGAGLSVQPTVYTGKTYLP